MKTLSVLIALLVGTSVFADSHSSMDSSTPKGACGSLVSAAQNNDFDAFTKLSVMHHPGMAGSMPEKMMDKKGKMAKNQMRMDKMHQRFEDMHKAQLEKIKALECGIEHIADSHAFVETSTNGKTRFAPFVKEGNSWKFDTHTYMSFYEPEIMKSKMMDKMQDKTNKMRK